MALWKHKTEFKVHRVFRTLNITDNNQKKPVKYLPQYKKNLQYQKSK